jgi:hypothetical protein
MPFVRKTMKQHTGNGRPRALLGGLAAGVAAALIAGQAIAASDHPRTPCFYITQWQGWKAPDANTLYLGVNLHDVYRADLSAGSPQLLWPDAHLVSQVRGPDSICSAIDLQLAVSDINGFRQPLIVRKLTKLTPEEIAAIPKKYRPN